MKRAINAFAFLFTLMVLPRAAQAQLAWDSPMLLPPNPTGTYGIYLVDVEGGGLGALGTWRSSGYNFGLRAGIAENDASGIGVFGGVDYNGNINKATSEFPLDIDWVFGAGVGIGDGVRISLPLGLTGGHSFTGDGATFTPYATPRVVLDGYTGSRIRDDGLSLDFAMDIGLDLKLASTSGGPFAGMTIRFAGTVGNREGVAVGIVF
jgi:hypothetical protein